MNYIRMAQSRAWIGAIMVLNQNIVDHVQPSHQQQPHQQLVVPRLDQLQTQKIAKRNVLMSFTNVFHLVPPMIHFVNLIAVEIILIAMLHVKLQQLEKQR